MYLVDSGFEESAERKAISLVEVAEIITELPTIRVAEGDEICPEMLKILIIVRLSWLIYIFNVPWRSAKKKKQLLFSRMGRWSQSF